MHVIPVLGERRLQQLNATEIDRLYEGLERKGLASRTQHQTHSVLNSLLNAAVRKGLLTVNPINRAEKIPRPVKAITAKFWMQSNSTRYCKTSKARLYTRLSRLQFTPAQGVMRYWRCNGVILIRLRRR